MGEWIESHAALRDHPKLKKLARLLGVNRREATGLLHWLWWWAMDYAPDGYLTTYSDVDIADGIDWEGDPKALIGALGEAGFIDQDECRLHDWEDYGEKLHRRRRYNAQKMREARLRDQQNSLREASEQHVSNTCNTHDTHVPLTSRPTDRQTDRQKEGAPSIASIASQSPSIASNGLGDYAFRTLPTSQSTLEDYCRTVERHKDRLPRPQIERVILELAEWEPPKPRAKLHRTLNTWLAKEQPEATAVDRSPASQFYFPEIPESEL